MDMVKDGGGGGEGMRVLGKYELGKMLGEGNFGKVRYALDVDFGRPYAIKILDRRRIQSLKIADQIKREIATLKLLKHPNVVRLYEVSASKTKIYMVLEYVNGGELFDRIVSSQNVKEGSFFQQLIDAVSYCHDKGVYHRDLKPENVLVDAKGNIKVSDFGLSALPQHFGNDGLLHTTCGSPNYIAPEVLANRGYDGARSDIWSCGVILYVILTGSLPFDDRNLAVLYQKIIRGDTKFPKWLSSGAQDILKRILDPNPMTRINVTGIKAHDWFNQDYTSVVPIDEEEDLCLDDTPCSIKEHNKSDDNGNTPTHINAFQLIGMSSSLDLSGFFEKEDVSERKIRFASDRPPKELYEKIEDIVTEMGFQVQKGHGKLKVIEKCKASKCPGRFESLSVAAQVFELSPSLYVVEIRKSQGDSMLYRQRGRRMYHNFGSMSTHSDYLPLMVMGDNSSDLTMINDTSVGLHHQLLQPPCFDPINGFSGSAAAAAADMFYAELQPVMDSSNAVFYHHHHPVHYDALVNQAPSVFEAVHGEQKLLENRTRHHAWGLKQGGQKNEKQRRERLGKKFEDLKSLIPNSTKPYRASIVADTIEYINELLRTVEELKMLAEKKRQRGKKMAAAAAATAAGDVESCSSLAVAAPLAEGGPSSGMLRSSWIQRKSKETFVDVRIVDDEVNIKVTRRRRANCLLAVAKALDELHLELMHLSAGNVGGSHIFMLNAKIHDGSSVYAGAIAKKLIEAIDVV
uniref:non-specific serine/threonine protein kinase n=1 Tax=Hedychium coronarium TaxID=71610 RepID=A0A898BDL7_HEDCO|nr:CBL-interacting protein kinase [Hedychium coronarium]